MPFSSIFLAFFFIASTKKKCLEWIKEGHPVLIILLWFIHYFSLHLREDVKLSASPQNTEGSNFSHKNKMVHLPHPRVSGQKSLHLTFPQLTLGGGHIPFHRTEILGFIFMFYVDFNIDVLGLYSSGILKLKSFII